MGAAHKEVAQSTSDGFDERRDIHEAKIAGKQDMHADIVSYIKKEAARREVIEGNRSDDLRTQRAGLDKEITASHEVVGIAFGMLAKQYIPGVTPIEDLFDIKPLSRADAAKRAGLHSSYYGKVAGIQILKWLGMAGCIILGTVGLGAMVLMKSPSSLLGSPIMLTLAIGLSFILVGGAYMAVQSSWPRIGAMKATKPNEPETKRAQALGIAITTLFGVVVSVVDTKAILALTATRAIVNADAAPSTITAAIAATALSAAYVIGSSAVAFSEGYSGQAEELIAAEISKDHEAQKKELCRFIEVQNAVDAYNKAQMFEVRRKKLTEEIGALETDLHKSRIASLEAIPDAPELKPEHKEDLAKIKAAALYAATKQNAHVAHNPDAGSEGN
jgi:hypothetical protein